MPKCKVWSFKTLQLDPYFSLEEHCRWFRTTDKFHFTSSAARSTRCLPLQRCSSWNVFKRQDWINEDAVHEIGLKHEMARHGPWSYRSCERITPYSPGCSCPKGICLGCCFSPVHVLLDWKICIIDRGLIIWEIIVISTHLLIICC